MTSIAKQLLDGKGIPLEDDIIERAKSNFNEAKADFYLTLLEVLHPEGGRLQVDKSLNILASKYINTMSETVDNFHGKERPIIYGEIGEGNYERIRDVYGGKE